MAQLLALGVLLGAASPRPQASAPAATFLGRNLLSSSGRPFAAFSGIRYARPVAGYHKFTEPQFLEDATLGTKFLATSEGPDCIQIDPYDPSDIIGSDDCLFLNVYSPNVTAESKMPVMVWIHGGGWRSGTGGIRMYGPHQLMDKDVVVVTMNYRLGPIGFSSLEDEVHPGNLGLKDQRAAMIWVKRNIHAFGGDRDRITLFGQSAGAASVHFHMMSPSSTGLFHRGISESGTALGPWALAQPGAIRARTLQLASYLNCTSTDSEDIMHCLRESSAKEIINALFQFDILERELNLFRPVIEKSPKGVIIEDPWTADPSSMPWIVGTTSSEASYFAALLGAGSGPLLTFIDAFYELLGPQLLMFADVSPEPLRVAKAVRTHYLQDSKISVENIKSVIQMLSDAWFTYPGYEAARKHNGTLYNYYFDHKGRENVAKSLGSDTDLGVSHGEEIPYLFNNTHVRVYEKGSTNDRKILKEMIELWTNFARTGDPNPSLGGFDWPTWTPWKRNTLHITSSSISNERDILRERIRFWEALPLHRASLKSLAL